MLLKRTWQVIDELHAYKNPKTKIARMVRHNEIFPVIRGLYVTDKNVFPPALAGSIYGPSYISFEMALSFYGLIPERVFVCKSATCGKHRGKQYFTQFGRFEYADVPAKVFLLSVVQCKMYGYDVLMASPEKAVCDQLYSYSGKLCNQEDLDEYLFENMRYDEEVFSELDGNVIKKLAPLYDRKNLTLLAQRY